MEEEGGGLVVRNPVVGAEARQLLVRVKWEDYDGPVRGATFAAASFEVTADSDD
jgi:hypothetical protein